MLSPLESIEARLGAERDRTDALIIDLKLELAAIAESTAAGPDDEHDAEGSTVAYERARVQALLALAERRAGQLEEARRGSPSRAPQVIRPRCASAARPRSGSSDCWRCPPPRTVWNAPAGSADLILKRPGQSRSVSHCHQSAKYSTAGSQSLVTSRKWRSRPGRRTANIVGAMRPTIVVATCERAPDLDDDWPLLRPALTARGFDVSVAAWSDPAVGWASFDLAVIRGTWDYVGRLEEFLAWVGRVASETRLVNPAPAVAWNLDKRYLDDLAVGGVPVVPTSFVLPRPGLGSASG